MKILLTQLRRIGDVITTTPAVRAVRAAWPGAQIDYLTEPPSDEIFKYNPHINKTLIINRRPSLREYIDTFKQLRANKYDVVVDFFSNPTSAYLTWLSGAKHRIGFDVRYRKYFYNHTINTAIFPQHTYAGIHKLGLVAHIGAMPVGYEPEFFIGDDSRQQADQLLTELGVKPDDVLITLGIVTRHEFRQWPLERFAKLADTLIERYNAKILFIYGPGEEEYPVKVRSFMKREPLSLYNPSGIGRMRAVFERAAVHIGCDNGPANIAKASGMPTVILYSNSWPSSWTPPGNPRYKTLAIDLPCKYKCLHEHCPDPLCIRSITVEDVMEKTEEIMVNR